MENVFVSDLDERLTSRKIDPTVNHFYRQRLAGRGYLLVSDDEAVRDSARVYLERRFALRYLDFNAEPQGKKISEMCLHAFDESYEMQKQFKLDVSRLNESRLRHEGLIVDNFQDIELIGAREAKLALAFLRSLGRPPYDKTVIGIGSLESLDLIKQDTQLYRCWATYRLMDG